MLADGGLRLSQLLHQITIDTGITSEQILNNGHTGRVVKSLGG